jgi:hypothetical protein
MKIVSCHYMTTFRALLGSTLLVRQLRKNCPILLIFFYIAYLGGKAWFM